MTARSRRTAHRVIVALLVGLIGSACGAAPEEGVVEPLPAETTTTLVSPIDVTPEERVALAASQIENLDTFRFRVRVEAAAAADDVVPFDLLVIEADGAVDVAGDRSTTHIVYTEGLFAAAGDDVPNFTDEIRIGDDLYQRGYHGFSAFTTHGDHDAWYQSAGDGFGADAGLIGLIEETAVADLLAAADDVTDLGTETLSDVTVTHLRASLERTTLAEVAENHPGSIADLDLDAGGPAAVFDTWIDDDGLTHRLTLTVDEPFAGIADYAFEIDLFDFGAPLDISAPAEYIETPNTNIDPDMSSELSAETTEIKPGPDGTLLRLNVREGDRELQLSIEDNGRVVAVTDTSILATPDDYRTWQISPTAVDILVTLVEASELLDHPEANLQFGPETDGLYNSAAIFYNDGFVLEMDGLGRTEGFTEEQMTSRLEFESLVEQLQDMSWLGDQVVTDPAPFVPDGLTLLASPATPGRGPVSPWPLAVSIEELAAEPVNDPTWAGLPLCVYGDQVGPVFALTEQVGANLLVDDGTQTWDILVRPHLPGYRLYGDPCP